MFPAARILRVAALLGAAVPFGSAPAEEALQAQVLARLQETRTLAGRYEQVAPDGTRTSGAFWLARPGQFHFAEDDPEGLILVSDGSWVAVIDRETGEAPLYPLDSTPIAALFSDNPESDPSVHILHTTRVDNTIQTAVARRGEEALGKATLVMREADLQLLGWVVEDAQGLVTVVRIEIESRNAPVSERLFRYHLFVPDR